MPTEYMVIMAIRLIGMEARDSRRQLPVHEKHSHIDRDGDHQVCDPLRHRVGQQDLQTVHIIDKQLFDCAGAFILNDTEGQLFKPF